MTAPMPAGRRAGRAALRRSHSGRLFLLYQQERRRHRRQGQTQLDPIPAREDARGAAGSGAEAGPRRQPARRVIIKYPNWYEHFQGLGYDLDMEAKISTSSTPAPRRATRNHRPAAAAVRELPDDPLLRQHPSAAAIGGGWVDTYDTRYADRYAEQLWDTLFAQGAGDHAVQLGRPGLQGAVGRRARRPGAHADQLRLGRGTPQLQACERRTRRARLGARGRLVARAGRPVLGQLGKPIGIASYKPYQSSGEDFLQDYLGIIGIPIEMTPEFPPGADMVLLTESAASDPDIVAKIKRQLARREGRDHLRPAARAAGRGFEDIVELEYTGRKSRCTISSRATAPAGRA